MPPPGRRRCVQFVRSSAALAVRSADDGRSTDWANVPSCHSGCRRSDGALPVVAVPCPSERFFFRRSPFPNWLQTLLTTTTTTAAEAGRMSLERRWKAILLINFFVYSFGRSGTEATRGAKRTRLDGECLPLVSRRSRSFVRTSVGRLPEGPRRRAIRRATAHVVVSRWTLMIGTAKATVGAVEHLVVWQHAGLRDV